MFDIIVETFLNDGEPSSNPVRVRPLPGQLVSDCRVSCSVARRKLHPPRTLYLVPVRWVTPVTRKRYLRIHPSDEWRLVSKSFAKQFIGRLAKSK